VHADPVLEPRYAPGPLADVFGEVRVQPGDVTSGRRGDLAANAPVGQGTSRHGPPTPGLADLDLGGPPVARRDDGQVALRAGELQDGTALADLARAAVAEVGVDVTAHEIARRAGVGIGTFYRRVPSWEELLAAVLTELLEEMLAVADQVMDDPDPWRGFTDFATAYVRLRAASCGLNEALGGECGLALDPQLARLRERIRLMVEHAREAGVLRPDVPWEDVAFLLALVTTATRTLGLRAGDEQWRRNLRIVLDGLRAERPDPPAESAPGPGG
jgi:AcrR family transcriptional regulator